MRVVSLDSMNDELEFKCRHIKSLSGLTNLCDVFVTFFKISYDRWVGILTCSLKTLFFFKSSDELRAIQEHGMKFLWIANRINA